MKKNQKYTAEEMNLAIELWKESGLSQQKYCTQNHIAISTFKYWQKKLQKEKFTRNASRLSGPVRPFISVDVPSTIELAMPVPDVGYITISYPNGIQVSCPVNINHEQLRTLIQL